MLVITIVAIIAVVCSALIFFWIGYKRGVEHGTTAMADMYERYAFNFLKETQDEDKANN